MSASIEEALKALCDGPLVKVHFGPSGIVDDLMAFAHAAARLGMLGAVEQYEAWQRSGKGEYNPTNAIRARANALLAGEEGR